MRIKTIALTLVLLSTPMVAMAHDVVKGPNGGQVVDDAGHHVEFTSKGEEIVLYLSDNADKPLSSAKATGRVIVQDSGKQVTAELAAIEPNILSAKLAAPITAGVKLAITIKLGDGHDVKARFVAK
jgi:hypothetical protein